MSGLTPLHRRLSEKLPGWQAIGADPTTLKWIKHGVPVEFLGGKPAPFVMHELPVSEQESKWWLSKEAPRLIALGVLSERHLVCLLALIQIRAFSGVTTKRQSPESLLSHAKITPGKLQAKDQVKHHSSLT